MRQSSVLPMPASRAVRFARKSLVWLPGRGLLYLIVVSLSALFAFPFLWTILSSLKTASEWFTYPPQWIPAVPQWNNYVQVWEMFQFPVARWTYNSLVVVVMSTAGTLLTASLVAYGFARIRFRGRDALFMISLGTMMLPAQVTLIPQFIMFFKMKWLNTLLPLWVPSWFGGGAFYIFVLRQFIMTLPKELDEAARIDGAGYLRVFSSILMPLCKPSLATVGIVSFMNNWSDFMGPLVYLRDKSKFTVALGLRFFNSTDELGFGQPVQHILMAATVLSIIPPIVVFFGGQSLFVKGIATTGLKG